MHLSISDLKLYEECSEGDLWKFLLRIDLLCLIVFMVFLWCVTLWILYFMFCL